MDLHQQILQLLVGEAYLTQDDIYDRLKPLNDELSPELVEIALDSLIEIGKVSETGSERRIQRGFKLNEP